MQLTLTVMWRGDGPRGPLFEQQQDLLRTCLQRTASLAKFAYDSESKSLLIETNGARHITHVERRFKNAIRFRLHFGLPSNPRTASNPHRRCVAGAQLVLRLRYTLVLGGRLYASQVPCACRFARLHPGLLLGALPRAAVRRT